MIKDFYFRQFAREFDEDLKEIFEEDLK